MKFKNTGDSSLNSPWRCSKQQLCQWVWPVCLRHKMVTVTREGRIAACALPLLYLTVVVTVVGAVASEHWLCWQACNTRDLLDTSKLMYQGSCIFLRFFSRRQLMLLPGERTGSKCVWSGGGRRVCVCVWNQPYTLLMIWFSYFQKSQTKHQNVLQLKTWFVSHFKSSCIVS